MPPKSKDSLPATPEKPKVSRRSFLKASAALLGLGVSAAASLSKPKITSAFFNQESENDREKNSEALLNSIVKIFVYNTDGSYFDGMGVITDQYGEYYVTTADHVLHEDAYQAYDSDRQVWIELSSGQLFNLGAVSDWQNTPKHPHDRQENGAKYYKLKGQILLQIKRMIREDVLEPTYFNRSILLRRGQRVAVIRKDLPKDQQVQYAKIMYPQYLFEVSQHTGINPSHQGINAVYLIDEDNQAITCEGMSGSPLYTLDEQGELTGRAIGLIVSSSGQLVPDAIGSLNDGAPSCAPTFFVRPISGGQLRNQVGEVLGRDEFAKRDETPQLHSEVIRVVPQ
jgi:hypothetical protein